MKYIFISLLFCIVSMQSFADVGCDDPFINYDATYEPNEYTCDAGEFLPANAIECTSCPTGQTCPGGTFDFDPDRFSGLTINTITSATLPNACAKNQPINFDATYAPNKYTCSAGYYLPANGIECVTCPTGYTCAGGMYTFNETTDQGITPNSITINWGDANGGVHESTTCTYGGDIVTPTTAPAKRGYRFIGWVFD